MWQPYKTNILVKPAVKNKVIGTKDQYELWGEVLAVGSEVTDIKVGDTVGYTLWSIKDLEEKTGDKIIFIKDDPTYILGIKQNEG